jgi:hypothetical protein
MLPERHVWIFVGEDARFPAGAFDSVDKARAWIAANSLSGVLTAYPLDEGVYDWAMRLGLVTGRALERRGDARFVGSFSTAVQDHFHFTNGVES